MCNYVNFIRVHECLVWIIESARICKFDFVSKMYASAFVGLGELRKSNKIVKNKVPMN